MQLHHVRPVSGLKASDKKSIERVAVLISLRWQRVRVHASLSSKRHILGQVICIRQPGCQY
jgi:hypothetical protein